jgi:hypothetical protein
MPSAVGFALGLLYLQAAIWGLLCVGAVVIAATPRPAADTAVLLAVGAVAGALAGAKAWLAHRIARGSDRTRQGVIVVESVMGGLGALLTLPLLIPEGGGVPALACLVGGGLSLTAAIWLTKPPARQYFAAPGSEDTQANQISRPGDEGSAPCWRLAPRFAVASA